MVSLVFFALTGATELNAQVSSGTLVGSVFDSTGATVPNVKVDVKNEATGVGATVITGSDGTYRVGNLVAGTYDITAAANGMTTSTLQAVRITANAVATQNFTLSVGTVSTTVDVTSAATVIDTTTASIQNSFSTELARDLPVTSIGIGVANLSLLSAGVTGPSNFGIGDGPSVGGLRPYSNNFMIEGVDANNKTVTGSLIRFMPNDAVSEFTIQQNQVTAQYGHSSGAQFNTILKSGTNAFHGSAYDYLQNRNLNAIDQVVQNNAIGSGIRPSNPRSDYNRFGGSVGGPIKKDKLFFFVNYEYNPVGASGTPAALTGPTAAGFSALAGIPGLSATNLSIFKQYMPVAATANSSVTVSGVSIPIGTLNVVAPNFQNNQFAVATMDYSISEKDQVRGRYIWNRLSQIDANATLPAFFTFANNDYYVASIAEDHNFSATMNNELRLGYNRLNQPAANGSFAYPGLDVFPNVQLDDLGINIGPDQNQPQFTIQNTYQLQDNFTWVKGAHTIQFGFDGRRSISPQTFTQRSRGDYEYSSLELFLQDKVPDLLGQRSLGNPVYYGDQYATYEYAQDTWKIRPNFTLDLGLRYEYTTVPVGERTQILNAISNAPGFLTFGVPQASGHNFAPHIGIAYSPGSKGTTSIRAGFSTAYDVLYDNIGILDLPPQSSTTVDCSTAGACLQSNFLANGGIKPNAGGGPACTTTAACRALTAAQVPDQVLPYSIQWNFGVQHVFANNYTLEVRYLGTRGVHLDMQIRPNVQGLVTPTKSLPTYLTAPSQAQLNALPLTLTALQASGTNVVPAWAAYGFTNTAMVINSPEGWSSYHGLAVQLNRRLSNGLLFQGAYTWSHAIDNSTADFNITALSPRRPQDFQNLTPEKASSAFDRRQRFTLAAYYETPFFKHSSHWVMKNLVGNWGIAPIYTYESPEYATVQSNLDANLNGDKATDRFIDNPNGKTGVGSDVTALTNSAGDTVAYVANNPNAQYVRAGLGAYANGGRNTLPLRPTNNFDVNILKNFNMTERFRLQVAAQFFNIFNHPQFLPGAPNRVDTIDANLNNTAAVVNMLTPGNSSFNNPEAVFSSLPRQINLSLKMTF